MKCRLYLKKNKKKSLQIAAGSVNTGEKTKLISWTEAAGLKFSPSISCSHLSLLTINGKEQKAEDYLPAESISPKRRSEHERGRAAERMIPHEHARNEGKKTDGRSWKYERGLQANHLHEVARQRRGKICTSVRCSQCLTANESRHVQLCLWQHKLYLSNGMLRRLETGSQEVFTSNLKLRTTTWSEFRHLQSMTVAAILQNEYSKM